MATIRRVKGPLRLSAVALALLGVLVLGITSCRSPHEPTRRTEVSLEPGWPQADKFFHEAELGKLQVALPQIAGAEYVNDDELCLTCHEAYAKSFQENVHRGDSCEACHGAASKHLETRGKEPGTILSFKTLPAAEKSEICLKCHEESQCSEGAKFRFSKHAHCGVSCTDCHRGHYNVPEGTPATTEPNQAASLRGDASIVLAQYKKPAKQQPSLRGTSNHLGAVAPYVCYKCHTDMQVYQQIAGPHQILGQNGFNCTTCHDPHGKIKEHTRADLCLECHKSGSPTMAWHSSTHNIRGVACTDCHNPHPDTRVKQVVNISHTDIKRDKRMQMSVQDPEVCYKCHPKIFGLNALPSHHPIKEGKMVCGDCHDAHGQREGNLRAESLNLLCYKCHADKQGPFVFEHPPVTENCAYCHQPHGTVANNLLRQPPTFLCLRCHTGHRQHHSFVSVNGAANQANQKGFYTDCTQCHTQIHGSDLHGPVRSHDFMR